MAWVAGEFSHSCGVTAIKTKLSAEGEITQRKKLGKKHQKLDLFSSTFTGLAGGPKSLTGDRENKPTAQCPGAVMCCSKLLYSVMSATY